MKIKSKCRACGRIFLGGRDGCCDLCLSGRARRRKASSLRCQCGKKAIQVMLATVITPEQVALELEIPLCQDCYELESRLECGSKLDEYVIATTAKQILIVKSLPRAHRILKGRIL